MTAADNVVNNYARINFALIHVLPKLALALLLLSPVDLLGVERVAHTKRNRNSSRTRTDNRDFRQLARDVFFESKLPAQRDGQHARRVVIPKRERHLKVVWRVLSVGVNEVTLTKRSG